jgi:amino acid adenylation domain-containing protein
MRYEHLNSEIKVAGSQNVKERDYWLKQLSGELLRCNFPYDYNREDADGGQVNTKTVEAGLTGELFVNLNNLSKGVDHTLHVILTAGLVGLLRKYTGVDDILIATPIYRQEIEGQFINTLLVLRNRFKDGMTFRELLMQTRQVITEAAENRDYPFELLSEQLNMGIFDRQQSVVDVAVLLGNIHEKSYLRHISYNLLFSFFKRENNIDLFVEYNHSLYEQTTVERIVIHLIRFLQEAVLNPDLTVDDTEILTEEEKERLLYTFNDIEVKYPGDKSIHCLFEDQEEKNPDRIAVVGTSGESHLSYRALNRRSNRLAYYLRSKHISTDSLVGIMLERSPEMIVAILGILKAGSAYLPIDPDIPDNRVNAMLDDAQISLLLTENTIFDRHSFNRLQGFVHPSVPGHVPVHVTPPAPRIEDFDSLPLADRSLVNYEKYNGYIGQAMVKNSIAMQATRGCPYDCAYCHEIWPKKHVSRSAENIFSEVKLYYEMGVKRFVFIDDIFNLDRKNSSLFFRLIIKNGLDVQLYFPNGMRGDILTRDFIDLMIEAGTVNLALALETASPRLQKLITKNLNLEKFRDNVTYICKRYPHVILELFTMHGFPTESEEEVQMTLDFIKSCRWLHFPYVHILKIYPNTRMEDLALKHGISSKAIFESSDLAYHQMPATLPFDKNFTLKYQADFLNGYFLLQERMLEVLPHQMRLLTEDELVRKYDSYLPTNIKSFADVLQLVQISTDELGVDGFVSEESMKVPGLNEKIGRIFPRRSVGENAFKVLLLDLSQFFSSHNDMLYDVVEAPLGLMYIMTYLNRQFGDKIKGKIAKSRMDFDNYGQLKTLLDDFKPGMIGIRSLTFYKNFFHQTTAMIRQWGIDVPILAGGPYATSDYRTLLQDPNIDIAVLSEGELVAAELIKSIMENGGQLPGQEKLQTIPGIAFAAGASAARSTAGRELILLDSLDQLLNRQPAANPTFISQPGDLAYVIFTSGSTGKPKGMMIEHNNVVRLMCNEKFLFEFGSGDVWSLFHSYSFDFSVWEMYGALLYGGKLVVVPKMVARDSGKFLELLDEQKVTVLNQTPTAFYHLLDEELKTRGKKLKLRYIVFGGEALNPAKLRKWREKYPATCLVNMFGITETTVHVTYKEIGDNEISSGISNIGKAIPTLGTYIMDTHLKLLPPGVPGEIFVGGEGVGRGYLNRPELTREKFLENPYKPGERLYRSGDLARLSPNGEMEYLGRIDHQVKIRGFRIELREIERQLLKMNRVKESVVTAHKDEKGDSYLCAYIKWEDDNEFEVPELREYLLKDLPDYMVPSYFVQVDHIPLTSNGKVDKKALPDPKASTGKNYLAPRNEIEKQLVEIWSELFGIDTEKISIDSNFFDLGGHSLKATVLISKIHRTFNVRIPVKEVFSTATIKALAECIMGAVEDKYSSIKPVEEKEYYPMSSAQKRMFISNRLNREKTSDNTPQILLVEGNLDADSVEAVINQLIKRHEVLRTSFQLLDEVPVQRIHKDVDFKVSCPAMADLGKEAEIETVIDNFIRVFDLGKAPLLRVELVQLAPGKQLFMFDSHHIINDGISMAVLVKEYIELFEGAELPELRLQYKDFSEWQNKQLLSEALRKQEEYWLDVFSGEIPVLDLPTDYPRSSVQSFEGEFLEFVLNSDITKKIRQIVAETQTTFYILFLAVFNILLSKYCGQEDIVIGTSIAGRPHADLEHIMGFFVNTLAIRNYPEREKSVSEFLEEVKQNSLRAFENQDYQFETLINKLGIKRDSSRNPLFDFHFTFQNVDALSFTEKKIKDVVFKSYEFEEKTTQFDIIVHAFEEDDAISFTLRYCTVLFKKETIEKFVSHFKEVAEIVVENRDVKLKEIHISHGLELATTTLLEEDEGDFGI